MFLVKKNNLLIFQLIFFNALNLSDQLIFLQSEHRQSQYLQGIARKHTFKRLSKNTLKPCTKATQKPPPRRREQTSRTSDQHPGKHREGHRRRNRPPPQTNPARISRKKYLHHHQKATQSAKGKTLKIEPFLLATLTTLHPHTRNSKHFNKKSRRKKNKGIFHTPTDQPNRGTPPKFKI